MFKPLEELQPGDAFRPYKLFEVWSVRGRILKSKKLRSGCKVVWVMLADECASSGHDRQSQVSLAEKAGMSLTQFRHHLGRLVKAKLVHVEPELGRVNYTWLLYHSIFAGCSPLTPSETRWGGPRESDEGVLGNPITQRNYQRNYQRTGGSSVEKGTSYRGELPRDGRRQGEDSPAREGTNPDFRERRDRQPSFAPREGEPATPTANTLEGEELVVARDARAFWYQLSPAEKRNRQESAAAVADRIIHFRQYLKDPHAEIVRQAEHEITRALAELRGYGFTLHTNGKRKP